MTRPSGRRHLAVIVTHDREEQFKACLAAIAPQVDHVFVCSHVNAETGPGYAWEGNLGEDVTILPMVDLGDEPAPNLYWIWNQALEAIEAENEGGEISLVAVLNDDAVVPAGWFKAVSSQMIAHDAEAGCADPGMSAHYVSRDDSDPVRLAGYAFITKSDRRFDEKFWWWYGDNDFDWQARADGGVVFVAGLPEVEHPANGGTNVDGALGDIVDRDREYFQEKWGRLP